MITLAELKASYSFDPEAAEGICSMLSTGPEVLMKATSEELDVLLTLLCSVMEMQDAVAYEEEKAASEVRRLYDDQISTALATAAVITSTIEGRPL